LFICSVSSASLEGNRCAPIGNRQWWIHLFLVAAEHMNTLEK
jgi:hypothetical protein